MLASFSAGRPEYSRPVERAPAMQSERLRAQVLVERGPGGPPVRTHLRPAKVPGKHLLV